MTGEQLLLQPLTSLMLPYRGRGRPKRKTESRSKQSKRQGCASQAYRHSNLARLHQEGRLTPAQFLAGETLLWIIREVRRQISTPLLAQTKYQEKIQAFNGFLDENREEKLKLHYQWWQESIAVLKAAGGTTKNLIEDFICNDNRSSDSLSEVELQLIKRGLDHLTLIYQ